MIKFLSNLAENLKKYMVFETPQANNEPPMDRSDEAMEAARALIEENKVLRNDPAVKQLMENDFVAPNGKELDPGQYLLAILRKHEAEDGMSEKETAEEADLRRAMAVDSTPPRAERKIDSGGEIDRA